MVWRLKNAAVIDVCTTRIKGIQKYITSRKTQIPIAGRMLKPSEVVAIYQRSLDTRAAVATKQAELKAAQKARDEAEDARVVTDDAFESYVTNVFGADSAEAHEIGYEPKKAAVKSVETKQQAVVRGKATREARHTMGSKQKAKIKGTTVVLTSSVDAAGAASGSTTAGASVVAARSAAAESKPEIASRH